MVDVGRTLDRAVAWSGGRRRAIGFGYNVTRALVLGLGDPTVTYKLAGRKLLMPLSHDLPVIRTLFPTYGYPLEVVARATAAKYPSKPMVDIGANIGDTAVVMLAAGAPKVIAIEPSNRYRALLTRNVPEAFVLPSLLGPPGEGSIDEHDGTGRTFLGKGTRMHRLSEVLPSETAQPGLVKSDTDGMDQAILLADLDWLVGARPVLFVEYSPDLIPIAADRRRFFEEMRESGYSYLLFFDEQGRYVASVLPDDRRLVEDLEAHFQGGGTRHYADVAMMCADDLDIWTVVRDSFVASG